MLRMFLIINRLTDRYLHFRWGLHVIVQVKNSMFEGEYAEILNILKDERNFDFYAYNPGMLERRIQNRIIRSGAKSPQKYLTLLKTDPAEPTHLIENFMINVSRFFRDPLSFEFLAKLLPPASFSAKLKRGDRSFRIWSAGCSHGEEPYSVAILLKEWMQHEKLALNVELFATDYDAIALAKARLGVFPADSIVDMKHGLVERYFRQNANGFFEVAPEIKAMVQFSEYDLLDHNSYVPSDSIFGEFDLVLCRNVLIYFNKEYQEFIFAKLHRALAIQGMLVLGESEIPFAQFGKKFRCECEHCKIYEKEQ